MKKLERKHLKKIKVIIPQRNIKSYVVGNCTLDIEMVRKKEIKK